jgi:hypothetical protein
MAEVRPVSIFKSFKISWQIQIARNDEAAAKETE